MMITPTDLLTLLLLTSLAQAQDRNETTGALTLPNAEDCANRIKQAQFGEHNYFFSWEYEATKDLKVEIYPGFALWAFEALDQ